MFWGTPSIAFVEPLLWSHSILYGTLPRLNPDVTSLALGVLLSENAKCFGCNSHFRAQPTVFGLGISGLGLRGWGFGFRRHHHHGPGLEASCMSTFACWPLVRRPEAA